MLLLVVLILAVAIVFVLPASMVSHFLPAQLHAEDFSGRLVHGAAGKLSVNARDAGAVEWRLHPLSLLRLAIAADIHWVKVGFLVDGTVNLDRDGIAVHALTGGGPIDNLRDLGLAAGWRGTASVRFDEIKSDFKKLNTAIGKIDVTNLSAAEIADSSDLGGFVLQLASGAVAADGTITAQLNDTGGPVEAQAQIRLSPAARTGTFTGTLKERPQASPALRNQLGNLAQLHARDAAGRFPVEFEFTY
ncbi:MAG: type II secretion system protein N [Pseudomonadota bacterium]|nr:type II secretion system protein N [Pseudomonadota bacterium]